MSEDTGYAGSALAFSANGVRSACPWVPAAAQGCGTLGTTFTVEDGDLAVTVASVPGQPGASLSPAAAPTSGSSHGALQQARIFAAHPSAGRTRHSSSGVLSMRTTYVLSVAVTAVALGSLSACGSDDSSSSAPPAAPTPVTGAAPAAGGAPSSATGTATSPASSCPTGAASTTPAPVTDAKAARDALLNAVCTAPYDAQQSADLVISKQWQQVAPGLQPGLFADSAATPTTIASTGSFLLDYGHTMDQFFAFAVTDGKVCAGGVAVIPQTADGKASDTRKPTQFASVDVPSGQTCDAAVVQNSYRPGSVHP